MLKIVPSLQLPGAMPVNMGPMASPESDHKTITVDYGEWDRVLSSSLLGQMHFTWEGTCRTRGVSMRMKLVIRELLLKGD